MHIIIVSHIDIMLSYMHKTRSCIEITSIKQFIYK